MAKKTLKARPIEPCRKCGEAVWGGEWAANGGLCDSCMNREEWNSFPLKERYETQINMPHL